MGRNLIQVFHNEAFSDYSILSNLPYPIHYPLYTQLLFVCFLKLLPPFECKLYEGKDLPVLFIIVSTDARTVPSPPQKPDKYLWDDWMNEETRVGKEEKTMKETERSLPGNFLHFVWTSLFHSHRKRWRRAVSISTVLDTATSSGKGYNPIWNNEKSRELEKMFPLSWECVLDTPALSCSFFYMNNNNNKMHLGFIVRVEGRVGENETRSSMTSLGPWIQVSWSVV